MMPNRKLNHRSFLISYPDFEAEGFGFTVDERSRYEKRKDVVPRSYEFVTCFVSFSEEAEKYDATGRKVYIAACECLNVTPVSFFLRNIQEKKLDFKHRLLGPKGGRVIAAALEVGITWLHLLSILVTINAIHCVKMKIFGDVRA